MKTIRNNMFETNSSSTHSITLRSRDKSSTYFESESADINRFVISLGEYGWEWKTYDTPTDRLRYLLTQLAISLGCNTWCDSITEDDIAESKQIIYDSEEWKEIIECVSKYNDKYQYFEINSLEGYIDGQSHMSVRDCLWAANVDTIEDFLTMDIKIRTGNDNSWDPEDDTEYWWNGK